VRSKILYLISAAYFIAGFQVYHTKATTAQLKAADPTVQAHLSLFTLHQIGWLFMGTSIVSAVIVAYEELAPHARLAQRLREIAFGYSLMTFVLFFWTFLYLVSWFENGDANAVYGIANYGLTVGLLLICSRIVDLPKQRAVTLAAVSAAMESQVIKDTAAMESQVIKDRAHIESQVIQNRAAVESQVIEDRAAVESKIVEDRAAVSPPAVEEDGSP
jgi:hypothetical protein